MKLELSLYGTNSENGATIAPSKPVTLVQTDENEVILTLENLKSGFLMSSRVVVHRDENGWNLEITHEGDPVIRVVLAANAEARTETLS